MKIAVLMGGTSAERAISLSTGSGIAASLRRIGLEVFSIDAANGKSLAAGGEIESAGEPVEAAGTWRSDLVEIPAIADAEVVFVALHGGSGEDGTLQAMLDLTGRPYTGSGRLASGLAMDKALAKRLFEHAGVPTPRWMLLASRDGEPEAADLEPLGGLPVVVKPNDQGSTVGLTIVEDPADLGTAFAEAARHSTRVLIERFIPGRELTVSMLGEEALPVVEIIPRHDHYDYVCKYTPGMSRYEVPARLGDELTTRLQALASLAFQTLGCSGVGRVDFRLDPDERAYCLEVNTVPGMTPTSLVPMAAEARGISYDQLVERMVEMAIEARNQSRGISPAPRT